MSSSDHEPLSNAAVQIRGKHLFVKLDDIIGNGPQEILNFLEDLVQSSQLVESVFVKGCMSRGIGRIPFDLTIRVFQSLQRITNCMKRFEVSGDSRFGGLFIPTSAITIILRERPDQLVSLRLGNVILASRNSNDMLALAQSLRNLPSLTSIDLVRCRSEALETSSSSSAAAAALSSSAADGEDVLTSLQPIVQAISAMKTLQQAMLCETIISPTETGLHLSELCKSRSIQKLWWKTMPDTSDLHLSSMVNQLLETSATGAPTMLQELTIRSHGLGKLAAHAISDLIRRNNTLITFNLDLDRGEDGVVLADALKENASLQCLDVWAWNVEENSQTITNAFTGMLACNTALKFLTFQGLDWNNPLVDFYLGLNRAGRQRLLRHTDNRKLWAETLVRHKQDCSLCFYFLSRNPSILSSNRSGCARTSTSTGSRTNMHEQSSKNTNRKPLSATKIALRGASKREPALSIEDIDEGSRKEARMLP